MRFDIFITFQDNVPGILNSLGNGVIRPVDVEPVPLSVRNLKGFIKSISRNSSLKRLFFIMLVSDPVSMRQVTILLPIVSAIKGNLDFEWF